MSTKVSWRLLSIVVLFVIGIPVFASGGGGGGQSCQACEALVHEQSVYVYCAEPEDGSSGNTHCRVECSGGPDIGGCWCDMQGDYCYYIVVNG